MQSAGTKPEHHVLLKIKQKVLDKNGIEKYSRPKDRKSSIHLQNNDLLRHE